VYHHFDILGSTDSLTDSSAVVTDSYTYFASATKKTAVGRRKTRLSGRDPGLLERRRNLPAITRRQGLRRRAGALWKSRSLGRPRARTTLSTHRMIAESNDPSDCSRLTVTHAATTRLFACLAPTAATVRCNHQKRYEREIERLRRQLDSMSGAPNLESTQDEDTSCHSSVTL